MKHQMKLCGDFHEKNGDEITSYLLAKIDRLMLNYWRAVTMAKNQQKTYPPKWDTQLIFVNRKLTAPQLKAFEAWFSNEEDVSVAIDKVFHAGYKPSVSWLVEKDIYNVGLLAPKEGDVNSGMMLSSKSTNWFKALCMCIYKHEVVTRGVWKELVSPEDEEG